MYRHRRTIVVVLAIVAAIAMVLTLVAPAFGHRTREAVREDETTAIERKTDNVDLVAHHFFPEGTDMQFQRRDGRQRYEGRVVDETRDFAFVGGDAKSHLEDGAVHVFDVTDPTLPVHLTDVQCMGYHAEIAVWENLLFQGIDSAGSNGGCEPREEWDPDGVDQKGHEGIRVFDITDPARPTVVDFIAEDELGGAGVHNLAVVPWAGLLYIASSDLNPAGDPRFGYVDLTEPDLPVTMMSMRDVTPDAASGCHDFGFDPDRELAFCPAIDRTFIWDIADPRAPEHVSTIVNPKIMIHHGARLAPDGTTLVLNDEHVGAADLDFPAGDTGVGANGCLGDPTLGAVWFYDIEDAASPQLLGSFAPRTPEPTASPCTSHFYNFIPGTTLMVVGWYEGGIVVVDYENPSSPEEHAVFLPELGNYWAAYYWHGYLYGASRTVSSKGFGGGLWVVELEGVGDVDPAPQDEGTSWMRWTSQLGEPDAAPEDPGGAGAEGAGGALPTTGGGLAVLGALAAAVGLVRKRGLPRR